MAHQAAVAVAVAVAGQHRLVFVAPLATWKSTPLPFPSGKGSGTNFYQFDAAARSVHSLKEQYILKGSMCGKSCNNSENRD